MSISLEVKHHVHQQTETQQRVLTVLVMKSADQIGIKHQNRLTI